MKRAAFILVVVAQVLAAACRGGSSADLFDAVRTGDLEKVKALLQADPKLAEARTEDGSTALHLAALEGQTAVAQLLLANGAQVNARGLREETPLHMAMYDGHREVAEVLLASQADLDARNTAGETPLHLAVRKGYRDLVELLLEHHADVNAKDRQDATPLHAAVAAGHKEVIELLVSQNADLRARDKAGRTPKAIAAEKEQWGIVELLTPRVGDFYDVQRFMFEGAKTFTPQTLREALRDTRDFFEVSHPSAPQDAYLENLQRKLLLGYQHHGFPEARIEARADARAGRVVVTVEEGSRYVCAGIKVSGVREVPATVIIERLTSSQASTQAVQRTFDFQDKAPATNPLTRALADEAAPDGASWIKGEPAPFSSPDLLRIKELVTGLLAARGFLFPKVNVQVVPDKAARTAELQVEVLEEGPHAVIERVNVVGNRTNTAEAVLRYLDLKPGMELTSQLVSRIEDRLWRAARFLSYKVSLGSQSVGGRVPLQIELTEYDLAPPLAQEFSPIEEAMLKMREWLSKLDESGEDMVVQLSGFPAPAPEGELIVSPRSGLALLTKDVTRKTEPRDEYAILLEAGQAGFYSPTGGRKLLLACPGTQLRGFLTIDTNPAATNGTPFNMTLGAGFNKLNKGASAVSTYQFALALPPVACVGLAHRGNYSCWFDGDMLIRSNASMLLKLNAHTGRINEFRSANEIGDATAQLHFEPGAFARAFDHIAAVTAGLPDLADTNAPLSSTLAFLAEEAWSSKYLRGFPRANLSLETAARLPALLRQFRLADILAPLDRLVADTNGLAGKQEDFWIPNEKGSSKTTQSDTLAVITGWILGHNDELFAARSWAWTLLREACFTVQGKARYTDEALTGIYESGETGPLGYLAITEVLSHFQPLLARKFAARGQERLSAADFRRDCRLFLEGSSISSQCCQRLAANLRALDEEQVAALAKLQSPARGEFIRECTRRLRAVADQPVLEALAPALDTYWEQELKEQVANAFKAQAFDPGKAFEEGLAAYQAPSPDMSKAAKLFKQAAARGHPGAQYYLAMICERGAGVPKDLAAALDWYRQSATNGFAEAAVVLGNYYSEGLVVKQDHAEAFVWYSVAAAEGHRLAEVFRNSARRKLTARQLAEAEARVAAVLASRPKAAETPGSPDTDH
jgi:ankyrin repeat protein